MARLGQRAAGRRRGSLVLAGLLGAWFVERPVPAGLQAFTSGGTWALWHRPDGLPASSRHVKGPSLFIQAADAAGPHGELLANVEALRTTPRGSMQWRLYTDAYANGTNDAEKLGSDLLEPFLDHYREGFRLMTLGSSLQECMLACNALRDAFHQFQVEHNRSRTFQFWKFDDSFLLDFLEGAAKRLVGDVDLPRGATPAEPELDPSLEPAERVRALLRDPRGSLQWKLFCQKYAAGVEDPAQVDTEVLDSFLEHYESGYKLATLASALQDLLVASPILTHAFDLYLERQKAKGRSPWELEERTLVGFLLELAKGEAVHASAATTKMSKPKKPTKQVKREEGADAPEEVGVDRLTAVRKTARGSMQWRLFKEKHMEELGNLTQDSETSVSCSRELQDVFLARYDEGYRLTSLASSLQECLLESKKLKQTFDKFLAEKGQKSTTLLYKFDDSVLKEFLDSLVYGVEQGKAKHVAVDKMKPKSEKASSEQVERVKTLINQNYVVHQLWRTRAGQRLDPGTHSKASLSAFLEELERADTTYPRQSQALNRFFAYRDAGGEAAQQAWREYAGKNPNPFWHDAESLETFLQQVGVAA